MEENPRSVTNPAIDGRNSRVYIQSDITGQWHDIGHINPDFEPIDLSFHSNDGQPSKGLFQITRRYLEDACPWCGFPDYPDPEYNRYEDHVLPTHFEFSITIPVSNPRAAAYFDALLYGRGYYEHIIPADTVRQLGHE